MSYQLCQKKIGGTRVDAEGNTHPDDRWHTYCMRPLGHEVWDPKGRCATQPLVNDAEEAAKHAARRS